MILFEHPDFEQAVIPTAEHFRGRGMRPSVILRSLPMQFLSRKVEAWRVT